MISDTPLRADDLIWPLTTLDFEASGLGPKTYPIEVGIAIWEAPDKPIQTWASLINPIQDWIENGDWQENAERIHNIARSSLVDGITPTQALENLNSILGNDAHAYCNGDRHDRHWMEQLSKAAGDLPVIVLEDLDDILYSLTVEQYDTFQDYCSKNPAPHRAGPDAILQIKALAYSLGLAEPDVRHIVR